MIGVASGSAAAAPPVPGDDTPRVVTVVPNPVTENDVGEFVVVDAGGIENLTLVDGESVITVPVVPGGVVALSATPNRTRQRVDIAV